MIERITDASSVEVGRVYLVPCVLAQPAPLRYYGRSDRQRASWLPVTGPEHEDAEVIGFPDRHFHFDWRFMPERELPPMPSHALGIIANGKRFPIWPPEIKWRRRRCLRELPQYPDLAWWLSRLEAAYAGAKLKPDCRTCPHRGLPLNGLPERRGVVTCPGHGLRWNLRTGELVPRPLIILGTP